MKIKKPKFVSVNPFRWLRNSMKMRGLIASFRQAEKVDESRERVAVVIIPWLDTDVPWFSIAIGILWRNRGRRVELIVDDISFDCCPNRFRLIVFCINQVAKVLKKYFKVISLKAYNQKYSNILPADSIVLKNLCIQNAVWKYKGETASEEKKKFEIFLYEKLAQHFISITQLLQERNYECIMVPGGVYGSAGVWGYVATKNGIRVSTFDSSMKLMMTFCTDGVASKLQDIPRSFNMVKSDIKNREEFNILIGKALSEINKRQNLKDYFGYQKVSSGSDFSMDSDNNILIALNSSWDSAALGVHVAFKDAIEMMIETTRWILENSDLSVIIRQHPIERLAVLRSNDDYVKLLHHNFGESDRIRFIAAADPINTYDLLRYCSTVIVQSSTIGVESTFLGKVVITPAGGYYSKLGFVWNAETKDEYFKHLKHAIDKDYSIDERRKNDAILCYYITQCCNWVHTPLTAEGFSTWSKKSLRELSEDRAVQTILKALDENIPASYLQYSDQKNEMV